MWSIVADGTLDSVDRRAVEACRALAAGPLEQRRPAAEVSPADAQGDALDPSHRGAMARSASAYGPWESVYTRFSRWSEAGVLARLFEALACELDDEGFLIDATIVRAHQDASGAAKKGGTKKSAPLGVVRPPRST